MLFKGVEDLCCAWGFGKVFAWACWGFGGLARDRFGVSGFQGFRGFIYSCRVKMDLTCQCIYVHRGLQAV